MIFSENEFDHWSKEARGALCDLHYLIIHATNPATTLPSDTSCLQY